MHRVGQDRSARSARELIAYFVLAYGFSWGAILAHLATAGFDLTGFGAGERMLFLMLMVTGPSAAGLTLTVAFERRRGLADLCARFLRFEVGVRWYAFALLPVPIVLVAILLPLSAHVSPDYAPTFCAFGIVAGLVAGSRAPLASGVRQIPRVIRRWT